MHWNPNWPLVRRHALAAVYVPIGTLVGYGILVAVVGARNVPNIEETGFVLAGSSWVLVFAHLAGQDRAGARHNVAVLAGLVLVVFTVLSVAAGRWREAGSWVGSVVTIAGLLAAAGLLGIRWARRYDNWKARRSQRVTVSDERPLDDPIRPRFPPTGPVDQQRQRSSSG